MNDLCPNCREIKELRVESKEIKSKDEEGKEHKVIINSYFCNACNIFVKSEEEIIS